MRCDAHFQTLLIHSLVLIAYVLCGYIKAQLEGHVYQLSCFTAKTNERISIKFGTIGLHKIIELI
jgi:hypothetical protein